MRISDWSSDVCSSDLRACAGDAPGQPSRLAFRLSAGAVERDAMIVAGFGFRHGASLASLESALERATGGMIAVDARSEEHTSELQSLMRISYAVFCLKKKKYNQNNKQQTIRSHTNNLTNKTHALNNTEK